MDRKKQTEISLEVLNQSTLGASSKKELRISLNIANIEKDNGYKERSAILSVLKIVSVPWKLVVRKFTALFCAGDS